MTKSWLKLFEAETKYVLIPGNECGFVVVPIVKLDLPTIPRL